MDYTKQTNIIDYILVRYSSSPLSKLRCHCGKYREYRFQLHLSTKRAYSEVEFQTAYIRLDVHPSSDQWVPDFHGN